MQSLHPFSIRSRGTACAVLLSALSALVVACGGGSGGGGGGGTPDTGPKVLLQDGAELPGGFVVNTIESAALSNDRSIALIASESGTPPLNGIFLRRPAGEIQPILTPSSTLPEGLTLVIARNLVMSGAGDFSFELGGQLDDDAVYLYSGGRLSLVARTANLRALRRPVSRSAASWRCRCAATRSTIAAGSSSP